MSPTDFIVKDATAADFGIDDSDGTRWLRQYHSFNTHTGFNTELSRVSDATELHASNGKLVIHTATFQPYTAPKPDAKPNEDRRVFQSWDLPSGSWTFAAVFDGHAGPEIAEYAHLALPSRVRQALEAATNFSTQSISSILRKTVEEFDKSIADDLKALLPKNFEELDDKTLKKLVNDQKSGGKVYDACIRCMRGSTVIIALFDPKLQNLWVANLGDCQGLVVEYPARKPNDYKAVLMSYPHNARIEKEVQRVQSEHPGESEAVLDDRVLGAIAVSRALGDFTFKLPSAYTTKLFLHVTPGYRTSTKVQDFLPRNLTPPYVSGTPDVKHFPLRSQTGGGEQLKYALVLCSDGLTDLYYERKWTLEDIAQRFAKICVRPGGEQWEGLNGNLALHLSKDALGDNLEQQSRNLTLDLDFQHLDDTTTVVLSW